MRPHQCRETQASIAEARKAASAASFDSQQLPENSIERQALHNLVTVVDVLVAAVDANSDSDD